MGAIKDIAPPPASLLPGIFPEISAEKRARARNLTPKEFAGDLSAQLRVRICERTVQNWCERRVIEAVRVGSRKSSGRLRDTRRARFIHNRTRYPKWTPRPTLFDVTRTAAKAWGHRRLGRHPPHVIHSVRASLTSIR